MSIPSQDLKRILVVNVNWLGDVIFSIPVFKALRQYYPAARISCFAVPRVVEILQCVPQIDDIIVYDEKGKDRGFLAKMIMVHHIRQQKFDAVFLLHGSGSRAWLMVLAGIPVRVGYASKKMKFLTHAIEPLSDDIHKADVYSNLIAAYGLPVADKTSSLCVPQEAREQTDKILGAAGILLNEPFIVVHTSGNWDLKRWPPENWAQLIRTVVRNLKMKVVISEGPKEIGWAHDIAVKSGVNPVVLAGQTNLLQLLALLEKAVIVISADSGPLHMASCVSQNILGLYGPTMPATTGPRGKAKALILHKDVSCNRASCYFLQCPNNVCMKAITVEEVVESLRPYVR